MIIIAAIRSLIIIIVVIIIFIIIIICQLDQHSKSEENFPTKCNGFVSRSMDSGTDSQKRVTIVQRGRCDPPYWDHGDTPCLHHHVLLCQWSILSDMKGSLRPPSTWLSSSLGWRPLRGSLENSIDHPALLQQIPGSSVSVNYALPRPLRLIIITIAIYSYSFPSSIVSSQSA